MGQHSMTDHDEVVRSQWRVLERLEKLTEADARKLFAAEYTAQHKDAAAHLPKLKYWQGLPERSHRVYQSKADKSRVWRVCQFLGSDDRVLDIGMGHGWTAGVLAFAVRPAAYSGIDLTDAKFDSVYEMARVNGIDAGSWYLGVKDLYDLTPEWVEERKPTIALLLEVLEHLPDPQLALITIANALGPDTELLFSVPMLGRIESCWGHVSIFDGQRVRELCQNAGLHVHWVEPLYNTWQLLLVSRSSIPPARLAWLPPSPLAQALGRLPTDRDDAAGRHSSADGDPTFHRVPLALPSLAESHWTNCQSQLSPHDTGGVRVDVPTHQGLFRRHRSVGIAFRVDGLRVVRLELSFPRPAGISGLLVEGRNESGQRTVSWQLRKRIGSDLPTTSKTFVLRPGQRSGGFHPADQTAPDSTKVIEVVAQLRRRSAASMVLRRTAVVR
jgi:2-polyprenyl-3-methyl-5-hydroxy-6-metoxy-1,4-benzoquinol methylase